MKTTGTSTSGSYTRESDMIKSSGNGTALLDASLANDTAEDWDTEGQDHNDSGTLLRSKQKSVMQQQNFPNYPMVSTLLYIFSDIKAIHLGSLL